MSFWPEAPPGKLSRDSAAPRCSRRMLPRTKWIDGLRVFCGFLITKNSPRAP